ncbi:MAG TPA: NUDIX hydrolase [Lachnospiraceae bacterium]|nr:NUDIX hydrolase [Lachnospiraceae bacterium]
MEFIKLEKVNDGKYLKNYELTYINKTGKEKKYEIVSMKELHELTDLGKVPSGLSIIATCGDKLLLLHEFRMGINKRIYNLCAGMIEEGETVEECVRRELFEETGLELKLVKKILPASYSAVGITDLKTYLVFIEVEGTITDEYASANEDIYASLYSKEEVLTLLENEEFSSRAQLAAYYFTQS